MPMLCLVENKKTHLFKHIITFFSLKCRQLLSSVNV